MKRVLVLFLLGQVIASQSILGIKELSQPDCDDDSNTGKNNDFESFLDDSVYEKIKYQQTINDITTEIDGTPALYNKRIRARLVSRDVPEKSRQEKKDKKKKKRRKFWCAPAKYTKYKPSGSSGNEENSAKLEYTVNVKNFNEIDEQDFTNKEFQRRKMSKENSVIQNESNEAQMSSAKRLHRSRRETRRSGDLQAEGSKNERFKRSVSMSLDHTNKKSERGLEVMLKRSANDMTGKRNIVPQSSSLEESESSDLVDEDNIIEREDRDYLGSVINYGAYGMGSSNAEHIMPWSDPYYQSNYDREKEARERDRAEAYYRQIDRTPKPEEARRKPRPKPKKPRPKLSNKHKVPKNKASNNKAKDRVKTKRPKPAKSPKYKPSGSSGNQENSAKLVYAINVKNFNKRDELDFTNKEFQQRELTKKNAVLQNENKENQMSSSKRLLHSRRETSISGDLAEGSTNEWVKRSVSMSLDHTNKNSERSLEVTLKTSANDMTGKWNMEPQSSSLEEIESSDLVDGDDILEREDRDYLMDMSILMNYGKESTNSESHAMPWSDPYYQSNYDREKEARETERLEAYYKQLGRTAKPEKARRKPRPKPKKPKLSKNRKVPKNKVSNNKAKNKVKTKRPKPRPDF